MWVCAFMCSCVQWYMGVCIYVCVCIDIFVCDLSRYYWYGWFVPVLSRILRNGARQTTVQLNWSCWIKGSSGKSIQRDEPGGLECVCERVCVWRACGEPRMDPGSVIAWLSLSTDIKIGSSFYSKCTTVLHLLHTLHLVCVCTFSAPI